jgi:phage repressor protein C with HTH and peptisase S24 domain
LLAEKSAKKYDYSGGENMTVGERIRSCRKAKFTQVRLAKLIWVHEMTLRRWENGTRHPNASALQQLAAALGTTVAYLLGETDDPSPVALSAARNVSVSGEPGAEKTAPKRDGVIFIEDRSEWVRIPLFDKTLKACAGFGLGQAYVEGEIEGWHPFPLSIIGRVDNERPPFLTYVDGDSMEEVGIFDGCQVLVNPAEEVNSGESALVCWDNDDVAVKIVEWRRDGGVKIFSTKPEYPVHTYTREDLQEGYIRIIGKIMWFGARPKRWR